MDRGQTYDVVDTPPKDRCNWPAFEDFQEREENSKWRDIQKAVDKVLEVQDGYIDNGPSVVLKLERNRAYKVRVGASFAGDGMDKIKSTDYILNLGAKISEETENSYFDFKLNN